MNENNSTFAIFDDLSDRRIDTRIKTEVDIDFEYDNKTQISIGKGIGTHISRKGLTLTTEVFLEKFSEIVLKIAIPNLHASICPTAKINWFRQKDGTYIYGLQFTHMSKIYTPYFHQYLNKKMTHGHIHERRVKSEIISELVEFQNKSGKKIKGFIDHLVSKKPTSPFIVIPSSYGETKTNLIQLSYSLVKNDFNVLRFDLSNHLGESDGSHTDYNLDNVKNDILSAIEYVKKNYPIPKIGLISSSLSARAAIKACTLSTNIDLLVSIVGIINVQDTFIRVQNEDLIQQYITGTRFGLTNILGFEVDGDKTIEATLRGGYQNLDSTLIDLRKINCQVSMIFGSNDPWISSNDISTLIKELSDSKNHEFKTLPTMHKLKENPPEAKKAFHLIVKECLKHLSNENGSVLHEPSLREVGVQIKLERERSKQLQSFNQEDQQYFWTDYLKRFHYIYSIADYRDLLDDILLELGEFKPNNRFFDAGCGNGNIGLWLIKKLIEKKESNGNHNVIPINYIGGDIIEEALKHCASIHLDAQKAMKQKYSLQNDFFLSAYQVIDMNKELPFLNETFDKIACNLVVSYLENPVYSIKELIRVLTPGGIAIITSLKKDADISKIYRNFIEKAVSAEEIDEARNLLSNSGKIIAKEAEGFFRFFSVQEFQNILNQFTSTVDIKIKTCFGNQALMVNLKKK